MNATFKPLSALVLLALGPGCYGHHGHGGAWLGTVIGASIITAAVVSAHPPPPPPHAAVSPPPRPGYAWQPGYWVREDDDWAWVDGHWIAEYPGYLWEPSRWIEDPDRHWRLLPGRWVPLTPPPPPPPPPR